MRMRVRPENPECEKLLTREGRAALSFWQLVLIYLDPFALFKDASFGPEWRRELALAYNRERRGMLLTYINRWLLIAAGSYLGIASSEALAAHTPVFLIPAAGFGIGCSVAIAVAVCAGGTYLLLGVRR